MAQQPFDFGGYANFLNSQGGGANYYPTQAGNASQQIGAGYGQGMGGLGQYGLQLNQQAMQPGPGGLPMGLFTPQNIQNGTLIRDANNIGRAIGAENYQTGTSNNRVQFGNAGDQGAGTLGGAMHYLTGGSPLLPGGLSSLFGGTGTGAGGGITGGFNTNFGMGVNPTGAVIPQGAVATPTGMMS